MASTGSGGGRIEWITDRVLTYLTGSLARPLLAAGVSLLSIDKLDVYVFALQLLFGAKDIAAPNADIGISGIVGIFLILAVALNYIGSGLLVNRKKKEQERVDFLSNFATLGQAELQSKLATLFGAKNSSLSTALTVLKHPSQQSRAVDLYRICHFDVKQDGLWLALNSKSHKGRYWLLSLFSVFVALSVLMYLLAAVKEFVYPGVFGAGEDAKYVFFMLSVVNLIGLFMLAVDLKRMGTAITLVETLHP